MSQEEVINVLKESEQPLSRTEIANKIQKDPCLVSHALQKLIKHKEVMVIDIDRTVASKNYNSRRRIRLYFVSK
jgi:Mn-dependent DtxR family transcriptional regulator